MLAYLSQLAAPLTGTTSVTVSLNDPSIITIEVAVLALDIAWFYVGISNYPVHDELGQAHCCCEGG